MAKKTEQVVFRTTEEHLEYLKLLAESDDRTTAWVLNKMIGTFKTKGVKKASDIK
tara:strand:+ start:212 stop:376 length:165 start_codon:yes stop_codon:yes gene_type:complete